jgi:hypothetical protein
MYMDIPNINRLSTDKIRMEIQQGAINLYYGKTRLFAKTGLWTCPYGVGDSKAIVCLVPDIYCEKLAWLDNLARTIIFQNYATVFGESLPEGINVDDVPYTPIVKMLENGLESVRLPVTDRMKVFDSNGEKITDYMPCMSSQFSGYFLFDMSTINVHKGHASWTLWPMQVKIKHYCILPEGCLIYETEEELQAGLATRAEMEPKQTDRLTELDAVVDFDPDVNELL